jgi:hypothetical protein
MSVFNLEESEVNNISNLGKIALRDDFIRKPGDLSPSRRGGIRKSLFRAVSLQSIIEENKSEKSIISMGKSINNLRITEENPNGDNILLTENKPILSTNSSVAKLTLNEINRPSILVRENSDSAREHSRKVSIPKSVKFKHMRTNTVHSQSSQKSLIKSGSDYYSSDKPIINLIPSAKKTFSEAINTNSKLDMARKRYKHCLIVQTILNSIAIGLIIVDNEMEFYTQDRQHDQKLMTTLKVFRFTNLFITMVLYIIILLKLNFENKVFKLTYSMDINKGYTSKKMFQLALELIITAIIIPPYSEELMDYDYFFYNIKRIISVLCFLRLHHFLDQILLSSPFQYKKARFLRSLLNLEPSRRTLLQSWFTEYRHTCLLLFPFLFFPLISYILMLAERTYEKDYIPTGANCAPEDGYFPFIWITGTSFFTGKYSVLIS